MSNPTQSGTNNSQWKAEDITRLKQLMAEGCQVLQEMEDLRAGLSDTVKAISEELDVKPSQLNKAMKIAHKASLTEEREKFEEIEDLLEASGRK